MKTSDKITTIAKALLKAQKEINPAVKGAKNPFFKSSYADINSILDASKEILNNNGIIILQPHVGNENGDYVETTLLHESGEYISGLTKVQVAKANDPQALGSAITYSRRYGLQSLLGMNAEDDDGEGAMGRKTKAPVKTVPKNTSTTRASSFRKKPAVTNNGAGKTVASDDGGWQ